MAAGSPMTDIQLTPGDRLRLDTLITSLAQRGTHLAVLSEHDRVLDHLARVMQERLSAQPGATVELGLSTNTERLVQQFNDILSDLTLDQALAKDRAHAPRRYLMLRDSILVQDSELRLLARLVNGFPASNTSVILLINPVGSHHAKLEAFGKSLLRWSVETRAGETRPVMDAWVADSPDEARPQAKLPPAPAPSWRIPGAEVLPPATPLPEPAAVPPPVPAAPPVPPVPPVPRALRSGWRLAPAAWLLVPLLSLLTAGWLYREAIDQEYHALRQGLLRGTPAPGATPATPQPVPADPDPLTAQAALDPQEEILPSARAAQVSPTADEAWMEQLAAGGFVVQLAAFDTEAEILNFQRSDPVYAEARVVRLYRKDGRQRYYALIAGPMATKAQAEAFMQSHRLLAKGWLRAAKSLKAKL